MESSGREAATNMKTEENHINISFIYTIVTECLYWVLESKQNYVSPRNLCDVTGWKGPNGQVNIRVYTVLMFRIR